VIARETADGSLELVYDSSFWSKLAATATVLLLAAAAYDYFAGTGRDHRIIGLLASAATLGLTAIVMLEQSLFRFDPLLQSIDWQQRWAFRHRRGTLAFGDVRHVGLERPIGDQGVPSHRVVLHLANGEVLPVTVGYRPDDDQSIARAADTVRRVLGHAPPSAAESARRLIEQGRTIDAVRLLAEWEGLSLTEAKAQVDRLRER